MTPLVLASASPRRRALLGALGLQFDIITTDVEEIFEGDPATMVVHNAQLKCHEAMTRVAHPSLVIAADTLVFVGEHVLGKPADAEEAKAMLAKLSGQTHQVLTGICINDMPSGREAAGYESTDVTFRDLTAEEIGHFVAAVNPVDRAGAYTVDGPGSLLVAAYNGCYQNVLGLPIVRLDCILRELGYSLFDLMDPANAQFL